MTIAARALTVEVLRFQPESSRAALCLDALRMAGPAAGLQMHQTATYAGAADWTLLWGSGNVNRLPAQRSSPCIIADLGYWDRFRKIRISLDAPHPQAWVMRRDWPGTRLAADRVQLRDDWNPRGPVILAGLGRKAREQYGDVVPRWEAAMMAACRARGWDVRYRQKQADAPVPAGVPTASAGPIDDVLRGASLVITWHSNVAVDALRLGIPAVCRDGAAAAVCPSEIPEEVAPLPSALRRRFLENLSWFQWDPKTEAAACWAWLHELLG